MSRGPTDRSLLLHASAVAWGEAGVLILGRSGAGKSGLVLRAVALGASLVADDRVLLRRTGTDLSASAPDALRGLVEARGIGILRLPHAGTAAIQLAVDLDLAPAARMPDQRKIALLGCHIRLICGRDVPNIDAIITVIAQNGAGIV